MKTIQFFLYLFALITLSYWVSQKEVVRCVKDQLGKPYVYGAAGPDSFDCSGLAYYCHNKAIPRTASAQSSGSGRSIAKSSLQAGDLMFWNTGGNGVSHTTVYIGGGRMIHAPKTGDVVKEVASSSSYWDPKFVNAKRYWS